MPWKDLVRQYPQEAPEALEKELAALEKEILVRLRPGDDEYEIAVREACPGRLIGTVRRKGEVKGQGQEGEEGGQKCNEGEGRDGTREDCPQDRKLAAKGHQVRQNAGAGLPQQKLRQVGAVWWLMNHSTAYGVLRCG